MKVFDVSTAEGALEVLEVSPVDILLTDLRLSGTSGLELLKRVTRLFPDVAVVMLTYGTIDSAVQATRDRWKPREQTAPKARKAGTKERPGLPKAGDQVMTGSRTRAGGKS